MNQYKVNYVDWKGRVTCMYVFADTEMEARAPGMVGQGVFKIINVEVVN